MRLCSDAWVGSHEPPCRASGVCRTAGAVYSTSRMIRILGTIFAGLLGLAFGSFLNVCLSRWPEGESVVSPRSHCRNCDHTLAWWENIPLLSWLALRRRCRNCNAAISWRYPLVELAIGSLWATTVWSLSQSLSEATIPSSYFYETTARAIGKLIFFWLVVALAALDAEYLWLPNLITLPGIALGFCFTTLTPALRNLASSEPHKLTIGFEIEVRLPAELLGILAAPALILLIRWIYWLIRRREGIGLGDAKLMALLGAWLGLPGALLAFGIGAVLGAIVALVALAVPAARRESDSWAAAKFPLGTFLCIGGIASSLWGQQIIPAYFRWIGL